MTFIEARPEVLIVGNGGREHALGWALAKSADIYTTPGNAGTAEIGFNYDDIGAGDIFRLAELASINKFQLTVVGPEVPLAKGIVNVFQERDLTIFGPTQEAAQIESSKIWARRFMNRHGISGPRFIAFGEDEYPAAGEFLESDRLMEALGTTAVVVKKDGLCAGKGAIVCNTREEAQIALCKIMVEKELGPDGSGVVIEEKLSGREVSVMAFSDGKTVLPMLPAEDYKAVYDGDKGPNTGGLGGVCPHWEVVNPDELEEITQNIMVPIVENMAVEGRPYQGILYLGLMKTKDGFKVLDTNCRGGDPETQLVLPLLKTPLLPVLMATVNGQLDKVSLRWRNLVSVGVVLASEGYPGAYEKGREVFGVDSLANKRNVVVFEAGTELKWDGSMERRVTSGGRVLMVVGLGRNVDEAARLAYAQIATSEEIRSGRTPRSKIWFLGAHYRTDIAQRGTPRYQRVA